MAVGTPTETLQQIPSQDFITDPELFFQLTRRNVVTPRVHGAPGPGSFLNSQLPQVGIISKLWITFTGTLTVATAAVTSSDQWPYNLLKGFILGANGQNDLFNVDGLDLHALRFLRYPAYTEKVDAFPGTVGGGDSIAVGTYNLHLTWEVPIAFDDTSLIGSIYAQSAATSLVARLQQAINADLFTANPANATVAGNFSVTMVNFDVPYDDKGRLVVPDLSRLHGVNSVEVPVSAVGDQRAALIRSAGQLMRLMVSVRGSATNRLSGLPFAASTKKLDRLRVEYGGNQRPYVFDPAAVLLSLNGQHYGAPIPYDRLVLDFVKENPPRDTIILAGVTELAVVPGIGAGVTITGGSTRVVQETLF
jgi:hypothetical protein